ncbi:MAG: tetratricopeptide repeat protein [Actinomycetota bacterium]
MSEEVNPGQILREHLFDGQLLQLPAPEEGVPGFLPQWFQGPLPTLVFPPLDALGVQEGENVNLEVTPYHIYYGTLRELAETAGGTERFDMLQRLALELNPNAGLEVCELARRHVERALLHYELAQELDSSAPGIDQTVEYCQAALDTAPGGDGSSSPGMEEPNEDQSAFQQAQALLHEDPAQSVTLLTPLSQSYPDSGEVFFILGSAHRRTGDHPEAERCLRRAARLLPTEPFIWWELAQACGDAGQWRAAEEASRKALELDPENPLYLVELGKALLNLGNREDATEAIRKAESLAGDDPSIQEAVALLGGE